MSSDLEDLFKKTIEINTRYFKEGSEIVREMGSGGTGSVSDLNIFQPDQMANAFTAMARLNLQHYQNVLDLGLQLTRQAVSGSESSTDRETEHQARGPAFELSDTLDSDRKATLDFLLENTLDHNVTCEFKNSEFVSDEDEETRYTFRTGFSPQNFEMQPGDSKKVTIQVEAGADVLPGDYTSRVEVLGFEPLFFLIKLNLPEEPTKKSGDGRKKGKK